MEGGAPLYDHHHAVQFYADDHSLFATVAGFLNQGFADGNPAIVIATKPHRAAILRYLQDHLIDTSLAQRTRGLVVLDAHETLNQFMDGDVPVPDRFDQSVGKLIARMLEGRRDGILIRAYGEMVDVLWKQGRAQAAIRLEMLWNKLAQRYGFALLCGYSMGNFFKNTTGFEEVCRQHTHVISPRVDSPAR